MSAKDVEDLALIREEKRTLSITIENIKSELNQLHSKVFRTLSFIGSQFGRLMFETIQCNGMFLTLCYCVIASCSNVCLLGKQIRNFSCFKWSHPLRVVKTSWLSTINTICFMISVGYSAALFLFQ